MNKINIKINSIKAKLFILSLFNKVLLTVRF